MLKILSILLLVTTIRCELEDFPMPSYSIAVSKVLTDYILNFFIERTNTINIYEVSLENNTSANFDIINEVLYSVKTKAVVQVDSLTDSQVTIARHFVNIFCVDSFASFEVIYRQILHEHFEFQGFFLVVMTTHMDDIYTTMMQIFGALWSKHIININVVFMPPENTNEAHVYTFFPYSQFYCEKVTPVQLNHYRDRRWINRIDYFPRKLQNFHGCPLKVATFSNPPFMIINRDKRTGAVSVNGLDGDMIRVLAQRFNFNVQLYLPPDLWGDIYDNGTLTGAIKMVVNEEVNMTLGFFATSPERDHYMKSGYVYYTTNLVWMVPPGKPLSALQKLLNPLGTELWIFTFVTILIGFGAIAVLKLQNPVIQDFVFGNGIQSPAMNFINLILGNSLFRLPQRNFARFLILIFLIYSFILRSCYTGGLVKFMQMDTRGKRMQTTAEMLDANFTFHMLYAARSYLIEMPHVLKQSKLLSVDEYAEKLKQMTVDPYFKGAFITSIAHLAYRNYMVFPQRYHHHAPEALYTLNIAIYMHKESCLSVPFDNAIRNLVNGGLVTNWASKFIDMQYLKQIVDENPKALSVTQLQGCFELLIGGLSLGVVAFVAEIFVRNRFTLEMVRRFKKTKTKRVTFK